MKHWIFAAALLAASAPAQEFKPGSQVGDFTLKGLDGKPVQYSALKGDVSVVVFVSTKCPISNGYNDRMSQAVQDYSGKGVRFIFVNSDSNESAADVAEHVKTHGLAFTPYKDPENAVADRFGATVTPEAFVIGADGTVRYHGYIDDSLNAARIQNQGLRKALDATLAGQAPPTSETKAFGCTIKRKKKAT